MNDNDGAKRFRIGVVGTGFIARGFLFTLGHQAQLEPGYVLTRRPLSDFADGFPVPRDRITNDLDKLLKTSDLIVECTGDAIYGTEVSYRALRTGLPVVTMNAELQTVSGTMLSRLGTFVEAEGDQPGSLAALDEEVRTMGFRPVVYGNIKRFLNINPAREEMEYWAKRQGISLDQVTAFTDGTKVQIEQALTANALGATIACRNLSGIACKEVEDGARRLAEIAEGFAKPISDYVLTPTGPAGVFIVATHEGEQKPYLEYLKLGSGPFYVIVQPYHLCHLEIPKTVLRILTGKGYSFNNGQNPTVQVAAVAKRPIAAGEKLKRGLGSFVTRGEAVKISNFPNAVPIALLQDTIFIKPVAEGQIITFDDVETPPSRAREMWKETVQEVLAKHTLQTVPLQGVI